MKKYLTVLAAFVVMLCIGSVYAWSIVAAELMTGYGPCATVFGVTNLGLVYPYVFLGYAIAGIAGPFSGGVFVRFVRQFFCRHLPGSPDESGRQPPFLNQLYP